MIKKVIKSLKEHKESAIFLNQGQFFLLKDGCSYSVLEMNIPSIMFKFLCESGYINKTNSYSGMRSLRIFDRLSDIPSTSLINIQKEYEKHEKSHRKEVKRKINLIKRISHDLITSSMKTTNRNLLKLNSKVYHKGCLRLMISGEIFTLGSHFSKKNMIKGLTTIIHKLENELVSLSRFVHTIEFDRARMHFIESTLDNSVHYKVGAAQ